MNSKKNIKLNFIVAILYQAITIALAFIVPKLIINTYSPQIHGLTATISSLITYLTIIEAGIGSSSIQGLYSSLQKKDYNQVNAGLNAISILYKRTGLIFSVLLLIIAVIYPFLANNGLGYWGVFLLVLISGLTHTIEYFFTSKYRVLLQADKRIYIINAVNTIGILIQGILRILLINIKASIFFVQLVPAFIYVIRLFLIYFYVKKTYKYLDKSVAPNFRVGKKRYNVLVHQISNLVVNNTDNIVLSTFLGYEYVSIYGIYQMVIANINGFLTSSLSTAITANFGHLFAKGNLNEINEKYNLYERLYYYIIALVFGVCSSALYYFVDLYIGNTNGVQYSDLRTSYLFLLVAILANIRIPQLTIVNAAGHYKETQNHAIVEAIINIVFSMILVQNFHIYGVLLGTLFSFLFRDIMFVFYVNKYILKRPVKKSALNMLAFLAVFIGIFIVGAITAKYLIIANWFNWICLCLITGFVGCAVIGLILIIFDKTVLSYLISILKK